MTAGNDISFEGMTDDTKRRVLVVAAINLGLFVLEMSAGQLAGSHALKADALSFAALGTSCALGVWAVGRPLRLRSMATLIRAAALFAMGAWIAVTTLYQFFVRSVPEAQMMGLIGFVALAANGLSVYLLFARRESDTDARAVWLGSRNAMIGNGAVMIAAGLVALLQSGAPDLIAAGVMAALFLSSAYQTLRQSWGEWTATNAERAP